MQFKKKWISYIVWTVAMVTFVVMAAQYAFLFGIDFLFSSPNSPLSFLKDDSYYDYYLLGWIVLFIGMTAVLFAIGRGISKLFTQKINIHAAALTTFKILLAVFVFIGGIVHRCLMIINSQTITLRDSACLEAAYGNVQNSAANLLLNVHSGTYIYISILSVFMQFLGTRAVAVVVLQTVIQVISIILIFGVGHRFFDYTTGLFGAACLAFLPLYVNRIFDANAGCFLGLCFLISLYFISLIRSTNKFFRIVFCIFTGIISGLFIYFDIFMTVPIIALVCSFFYEIGCLRNESSSVRLSLIITSYLVVLLSAVAGLFLFFCIDGGFSYNGFLIAIQTWGKVSSNGAFPEFALLDMGAGIRGLIECMFLVVFAGFTIYGFIGRARINTELGWLLMFAVALTPLTQLGYIKDNTLALIVYSLLCGAGISSLTAPVSDEQEIAPLAESDALAEDVSEASDESAINEATDESAINVATDKEDKATEDAPEDKITEDASESEGKTNEDTSEGKITEVASEENINLPTSIPWEEIKAMDKENTIQDDDDILKELNLIPNPLPVPVKKPHVAPTFGKEIDENEMHFDIDIDENDDFDI